MPSPLNGRAAPISPRSARERAMMSNYALKRVLLVEDEEELRRALTELLRAAGYEVEACANGIEAVRRFVSRPADLVITDIRMPVQEGIGTIYRLRQEREDVTILAMSDDGELPAEHYLRMAMLMGAQKSIKKPFVWNEFLKVVDSLT